MVELKTLLYWGRIDDVPLKFTNYIPIAFSTKKHYDQLDKGMYHLWEEHHDEYVIRLDELIKYNENLRLDTRGYNPKDTVMFFKTPAVNKPVYRERSSRILKAKIFSDFVGLDETEPNGLIQTEISKKIDLLSIRRKLWSPKKIKKFRIDPRNYNVGWFFVYHS